MTICFATVFDHPNQHFAPAFVELANRSCVQHTVLYSSTGSHGGRFDPGFSRRVEWDVDLLAGYEHIVLGNGKLARVWGALTKLDPSVVLIPGWGWAINRSAIAWCVVNRVPFVLITDSTWQHQFATSRLAIHLRNVLLRGLFALSGGALTTGTFNRQFYERHGMKERKLFAGCYPFDAVRFLVPPTRPKGGAIHIVYAGKIVESKGVIDLVDALGLIRTKSWRATIAGEGDALASVKRQAIRLGIADRIDFPGFVNQTAMPQLLGSASIFVVPSRQDFRVLVASEAMAAGAALVISSGTAVWGPGDLIEHDVSGLVFESSDPTDLARRLERLVDDDSLRERLMAEGRRRACEEQSPSRFADSVIAAAFAVVGGMSAKVHNATSTEMTRADERSDDAAT